MTVRVRTNPSFRRKLRSIDRSIPQSIEPAVNLFVQELRRITPVKTGLMKRSWRVFQREGGYRFRIANDALSPQGFPYPTLVDRMQNIVRRAIQRTRFAAVTQRELKKNVRRRSRRGG